MTSSDTYGLLRVNGGGSQTSESSAYSDSEDEMVAEKDKKRTV